MRWFWLLFALSGPSCAFSYWISGVLWGFHVWEKIPDRVKKYWKIYAALTFFSAGGAAVSRMRSCDIPLMAGPSSGPGNAHSLGKVAAAADAPAPTHLAMPQEILLRLRKMSADREREGKQAAAEGKKAAALDAKIQKQMDEIKRDPIAHVQQRRIRDLQKTTKGDSYGVVAQSNSAFIYKTYEGAIIRWTIQGEEVLAPAPPVKESSLPQGMFTTMTTSSGMVIMSSGPLRSGTVVMSSGGGMVMTSEPAQPIGTRKGPFCRVTCSFHHNDKQGAGEGDVEVDAHYCQKNRIEPEEVGVPGWVQVDAQYERKQDWPGPAQGGLDSYKLYWK
jgi:hypothetical protein